MRTINSVIAPSPGVSIKSAEAVIRNQKNPPIKIRLPIQIPPRKTPVQNASNHAGGYQGAAPEPDVSAKRSVAQDVKKYETLPFFYTRGLDQQLLLIQADMEHPFSTPFNGASPATMFPIAGESMSILFQKSFRGHSRENLSHAFSCFLKYPPIFFFHIIFLNLFITPSRFIVSKFNS